MRKRHHLMLMLATPLLLLSWAQISSVIVDQIWRTECGAIETTSTHGPSRVLAPQQAVKAQLDALRVEDIERVYAFASPGNKAFTGPLARFDAMVRAPEYAPLLGHREHILGELRPISDLSATIPVTVVSKDGVPYTYDFTVQRQVGGPWDGCYMTSMVTRADLHPRTR